jgi:carbon storage regulator
MRELGMLVLTRKIGEEIVISNDIHITVVEIRGGKVRIGIVAPENVVVDRQEIHEKRLNTAHQSTRPQRPPTSWSSNSVKIGAGVTEMHKLEQRRYRG